MNMKHRTAAMAASLFLAQWVFLAGCSGQRQIGVDRIAESSGETRQEDYGKDVESRGASHQEESRERGEASREIQAPRMSVNQYPRVDGSTATIPLSTALYQLVTDSSQEEALKNVSHTKTTNAYRRLIHGDVELVIAYEPSQTVYDDMADTGQDLIIKPIGKDALVFMANEGNPVTSLSSRELVGIYTGRYKNWSQVGGEQSEIIAFQRPENSGSQTLMEKLVMKGIPMGEAPKDRIIGEMGELIEEVASYNNEKNALGYSVYFYARNMYQKPGLRFMAVDGVMPDNETIKKGKYPYVNEFYAAVRSGEPHDSPAYKLFSWLTTEDGQALVESLGYVGMGETREIRVDMEPAEAPEPGTVTLEKGFRILLDGTYLEGSSGVVVLDRSLAVEQTLSGKRISGGICNVRGREPVVMTDTATEKQGLYSVEDGRWIVEPVYEYMGFQKDGTYSVWRGEEQWRVCWNEEKQQYEELAGSFERLGDYWWRQKGEGYEIFEGEEIPGQESIPVNTLDFSGRGGYYGYPQAELYIACFPDNSQELYSCRGELLFGEELTGGKARIRVASPWWVWASDMDAGPLKNSYVYNFKTGQVVTRPGDDISRVEEGSRFFTVVRDGETMVLDEHGERAVSADHHSFEDIFGRGFCGFWEQGILTVENPDTGKRFQASCPGNIRGYMVSDQLLYLYGVEEDQEFRAIYLEGKPLMEQDYGYHYDHEDLFIICGQERQIIVDSQGKVLYETSPNEKILWAYPEYLVVERGNYLCITDYEGTCGFRSLSGYLRDD